MAPRYLLSPAPADSLALLHPRRERGECLTAGFGPDADCPLATGDTWDDLCRRLPSGPPDFVLLWLPSAAPPALLAAPIPVVGIAPAWGRSWLAFRAQAALCDLVLAPPEAAELCRRAGIDHVLPLDLAPCASPPPDHDPDGPRDIDLLVVSDLHPAADLPLLGDLARLLPLADRRSILVHSPGGRPPDRALLARARIALGGRPGDCGPLALEAARAGALFFRRADTAGPRDAAGCVEYAGPDLVALLQRSLDDEPARRARADDARARAAGRTFAGAWDAALAAVEAAWGELPGRAHRRQGAAADDGPLLARAWLATLPGPAPDLHLAADLAAALARRHRSAGLHNALAALVHSADPLRAADGFRRALDCDPAHDGAAANLAAAGRKAEATDQARRALERLDRRPRLRPETAPPACFPPAFDVFRAAWESASLRHAGDPEAEAAAQHTLLRWRLHTLLAGLTGEIAHHYEAAAAQPDLPGTRAALGCALAASGKLAESLPHLRAADDADPADADAARALCHAFGLLGEHDARRRLARRQWLLSRAAPHAVRPEPWFADAPPAGDELASVVVVLRGDPGSAPCCVESVVRHTRQPYELILIDDGPADGATAALLEEARTWPGPERVAVLRSDTPRGFAAACNRGLAEARGRYLVLLDGAALVTPGWLEGLTALAVWDWPRVGLVGPVTSSAPPPQFEPAPCATPEQAELIAERLRRERGGQAVEAERLSNFCLLLRREVLEAVGPLDESLGDGTFASDDLCFRARDAGLRSLVAAGVYVHHPGDPAARLAEGLRLLRAKWGPERTAGYRVPPVLGDGGSRTQDRGSKIEEGGSKVEEGGDAADAALDPPSSILHPRPR